MREKKTGNVHNLILSIRPYWREMLLAIVSSLLKQVMILLTVILTSCVVGLAMDGRLNGSILPWLLGLGTCILLRSAMNYGEMWFAHDVAFRVIRDFRLALFGKISELSPAYTLRKKTGQLGQALISDVEVLELFLAHTFSGFVVAGIMTVLILVILLTISPVLSVMLSTVVLSPVIEASSVAQELGLVFAASNRIQNVLSSVPAVQDQGKEECRFDRCRICFQDVSFSYPEQRDGALHKVSFTIEPGETVVLVGHSGAGKTTCANLLLRYWDASGGVIELNGIPIGDYRMESIRKTVSAVLQDPYLFHASIRDNIRLGRPDATEEEVEAAAKAANAHEFIGSLPEGYDTVAGERGFRLSGGQRQRIAIARALLKDTPVVIFDEAVSSLDTENELYIQQMLKTRLKGKSVLMIAHRLSTILSADRIVVLEHGRVADTGTHRELLSRSGIYRELIAKQLI